MPEQMPTETTYSYVNGRLQFFKNMRRPFEPKKLEALLFYLGHQWLRSRGDDIVDMSQDKDLAEVLPFFVRSNRIMTDINVLVAKFTRIKPIFTIPPLTREKEDQENSLISSLTMKYALRRNHFDPVQYEDFISNLAIFGMAGIYTGLINSEEYPAFWVDGDKFTEKDVGIQVLTPFDFWVNPYQKWWWKHEECFIGKTLPLERAKLMFPDQADLIRATHKEAPLHAYDRELQGEYGFKDFVFCVEYYKKRSPENPKGRYIVFSPDLQLIFKDTENPYDFFPLVFTHFYSRPNSCFGMSAVEEALPMQSMMNFMWSLILDHLVLSNHGKILYQSGTFNPDNIRGWRREYIEHTAPPGVSPPQELLSASIGSDFWNVIRLAMEEYRDRMNVQAVDIGKAFASDPFRKTALLRQTASEGLSPISERVQWALSQMGSNVIKLAKMAYTRKEILKIVGREYAPLADKFKNSKLIVDRDVEVRAGSDLPFSKASFAAFLAEQYLQRLARNPEDVEAARQVNRFAEEAGLLHLADRHDDDRIVAMHENEFLESGVYIAPQPYEHFDTHLMEHFKVVKTPDFLTKDPIIQGFYNQHLQETLTLKTQSQITPQDQLKAAIAARGGGGGIPGVGAPPPSEEFAGGIPPEGGF